MIVIEERRALDQKGEEPFRLGAWKGGVIFFNKTKADERREYQI